MRSLSAALTVTPPPLPPPKSFLDEPRLLRWCVRVERPFFIGEETASIVVVESVCRGRMGQQKMMLFSEISSFVYGRRLFNNIL